MSADPQSAPPAMGATIDYPQPVREGTHGPGAVIDLRGTNPRQLAHSSVEALVGDVVHIFRSVRPGRQWPEVATAVLEHHEPPVAQTKLDPWYVEVQDRSRFLLRAVEGGNVESIRRAITHFREIPNIDRLLAEKDTSDTEAGQSRVTETASGEAKLVLP